MPDLKDFYAAQPQPQEPQWADYFRGKGYITPSQAKSERELAQQMLTGDRQQQVKDPRQGMGNMVNALLGGYDLGNVGRRDRMSDLADAEAMKYGQFNPRYGAQRGATADPSGIPASGAVPAPMLTSPPPSPLGITPPSVAPAPTPPPVAGRPSPMAAYNPTPAYTGTRDMGGTMPTNFSDRFNLPGINQNNQLTLAGLGPKGMADNTFDLLRYGTNRAAQEGY